MAAGANTAPIIIKKVKKVSGGGHHGGAWKVAYADFVTAMMAFFLLMWLINTTSPEQKRGIADFFAPASVSQTTSGSGGILAGTAMAEEGVRHGEGAPIVTQSAGTSKADAKDQSKTEDQAQLEPSPDALNRAKALREDTQFDKAEASIRQSIQEMPDIAELSKNVIMEKTPEGFRIQIVDQEGRSMFNAGDARLTDRAQRLVAAVSNVILSMPNRVSISGHTDMSPPPRKGYSNWELSADRANSARKILAANGVPENRIYQVSGKADSEPLFPDDPTQPGNRRISITLLREAPALPPDHSL